MKIGTRTNSAEPNAFSSFVAFLKRSPLRNRIIQSQSIKNIVKLRFDYDEGESAAHSSSPSPLLNMREIPNDRMNAMGDFGWRTTWASAAAERSLFFFTASMAYVKY